MSGAEPRQYTVAPRRGTAAPRGWQERLASVPGVTVIGAAASRARVSATSEGVDQLRALLGEGFIIEELRPRRTDI